MGERSKTLKPVEFRAPVRMANLDNQINMQQDGGDQQEDFHLPPPTTQISAMTRLVSTGGIQEQSLNIRTIQDRIKSATSNFKFRFFYQFWAPVTIGGQIFLTTCDQPYSCCEYYNHRYREVSSALMYSINIRKEDQLGPPGRVFLKGWPEFSPNVKYYSTKEYPLRNYALRYGVKKYCALPIFDKTGGESLACVGVLELLAGDEDDSLGTPCMLSMHALEEVGFVSLDMFFYGCWTMYGCRIHAHPYLAKKESQNLLDVLCKEYSLPVAQAWALCKCKYSKAQFGPYESHSYRTKNNDGKFTRLCVGKYDGNDDDVSDELFSCLEDPNSLQEGQGLVGKAFASCKSCFCKDITQFSIMDYPFVPYARECKLTSCFAIFLHNIDSRFNNYVLELFLAPGGMYHGDPQALLQSMLDTMAPHLHHFKVVAGEQEEQGENLTHEVHLFSSYDNVDYFQISQSRRSLNEFEVLENEREQSKINSSKEVENTNASHMGEEERQVSVTNSKKECRIELEGKPEDVGDGITCELVKQQFGKKVGDGITCELVEQQFGKKLEDAARSLHVSRSTLKRKLRELGINRWPSHKRTNTRSVGEELIGDYPTGSSKSNAVLEKGRSAADTAMQDKSTMIIKATYGDHIIRFPLSFSSGIKDLKCEIKKRLKLQSYIIKYKDSDNDWILMACNDDLCHSMQNQTELGNTSVQLLLIEN